MLDDHFGNSEDEYEVELDEDAYFWMVVTFKEFEDLIQLSHYFQQNSIDMDETLYFYKENYYLYIEINEFDWSQDEHEDLISQVLEFAHESDMTGHVLEEYGKEIFKENTLEQVRSYFPL